MAALSESNQNFKIIKLTLLSLLTLVLVGYIIGVSIAFFDYKDATDTMWGSRYSDVIRQQEQRYEGDDIDEQHVKRVLLLLMEIVVTFGTLVVIKREHFGSSFISAPLFLFTNILVIQCLDIPSATFVYTFILTITLLIFVFCILIYDNEMNNGSLDLLSVSRRPDISQIKYIQSPYDVVYQ